MSFMQKNNWGLSNPYLMVVLAFVPYSGQMAAATQESKEQRSEPPSESSEIQGPIENQGKAKRRKSANRPINDGVKVGLGVGLGFPDAGYLDTRLRFSQNFELRTILAPGLPVTVPITIAEMTLTEGRLLSLRSQETTIDVDITYGPQFLSAFQWRIFGGGLHLDAGVGYRRVTATVDGKANVVFCTSDSSCLDEQEPNNSISGSGTLVSSALLAMMSVGYTIEWTSGFYLDLNFMGLVIPFSPNRETDLQAQIDNPTNPSAERAFRSLFAQLISDTEDQYESLIADEVAKYDSQALPRIAFSAGWVF